ncbi:carbohydrate kinase family protein [Methanobrevibacter sp.]
MTDGIKLLVVGHTASDIIIGVENFPKSNTSIHMDSMKNLFGGAGANVAMVAAKLGMDISLISAVGEHFQKSDYYDSLDDYNVNMDNMIYVEGESNATAIMVNDKNTDQITFFYEGAGKYFKDYDVSIEAISNCDFIHLATGDPDYNWRVSCEAKKLGKPVSFDPGQDLSTYTDKRLKQVISNSKILFGNNYEIDRICDQLNLDIKGLLSLGPEIIIKTCREHGSFIYTNDGEDSVDAIYRPAVDPTGAGDSYKAAFLYYYLNDYSLKDSIKFASSVSSFIVEKQGCQTNIPTLEEATARMNEFYKN